MAVSKLEAEDILTKLLDRTDIRLVADEEGFETWKRAIRAGLRRVFGTGSREESEFADLDFDPNIVRDVEDDYGWQQAVQQARTKGMTRTKTLLESWLEETSHRPEPKVILPKRASRKYCPRCQEHEPDPPSKHFWDEEHAQTRATIELTRQQWRMTHQPHIDAAEDKPMARKPTTDPKKIFLIYGRNEAALDAVRTFLRALGLDPVTFEDVEHTLGGDPYIGEVVAAGMSDVKAAIAIFTPDEHAQLYPSLNGGKSEARFQARPNVIFEAGMAKGIAPDAVIFVRIGADVSSFSDVQGRLFIPFSGTDDDMKMRDKLRKRLEACGCKVDAKCDWLVAGDFVRAAQIARETAQSVVSPLAAAPPPTATDHFTLEQRRTIGLLRGIPLGDTVRHSEGMNAVWGKLTSLVVSEQRNTVRIELIDILGRAGQPHVATLPLHTIGTPWCDEKGTWHLHEA